MMTQYEIDEIKSPTNNYGMKIFCVKVKPQDFVNFGFPPVCLVYAYGHDRAQAEAHAISYFNKQYGHAELKSIELANWQDDARYFRLGYSIIGPNNISYS